MKTQLDVCIGKEGLGEVYGIVAQWRSLAMSAEVGLTAEEVEDFAPAFEHSEMVRVKALCQ